MEKKNIVVIGAGLAGTECVNTIATRLKDVNITLYEMKPVKFSPAHKSENFAELVCSNSLKSSSHTNACGLLKEEMDILGSVLMDASRVSMVPAGQALAVDRDLFSEYITKKISSFSNVKIVKEEVVDL